MAVRASHRVISLYTTYDRQCSIIYKSKARYIYLPCPVYYSRLYSYLTFFHYIKACIDSSLGICNQREYILHWNRNRDLFVSEINGIQ